MIISNPDIEVTKQLIKKAIEKPIIVQARDDAYNRKMIEYGKFDILLGVEMSVRRKDGLKQLDSGLNEIVARIAAKNGVALGVDLETIRNLKGKEKAQVLGRIRQNIAICRKTKTKITFMGARYSRGNNALVFSLGGSSVQIK